jgi:hypothetical protein
MFKKPPTCGIIRRNLYARFVLCSYL